MTGSHGLRGDLKVRTVTSGSQVLLDADRVTLQCRNGQRLEAEVITASVHKQQILLRLAGYEDVNQIGMLLGAEVLMSLARLPELEDDSCYWHQLEGLQVVDSSLGEIGILTRVFETAGHDVYVTEGRYGEVMIPAVAAFITAVDLEHRVMKVTLPEGLIELNK